MILHNLDYDLSVEITSIESKRAIEQLRVDANKTSTERNRLGQIATPNSLGVEIINYSLQILPSKDKIRFLDPAFGTGSLYSALLHSLPIERIESAVGYEIDRDLAEIAANLWINTPLKLNIADFTTSTPPDRVQDQPNLLICNPPYVRHHYLSVERKKKLKQLGAEASGIQLNGLSGLYCYFLSISHRWMADGGLACWLIPAEFMDVNYGEKIREYLLNNVKLIRVHRFDATDLQFPDVLVSSSVIWFANTRPNDRDTVEFTLGGSIEQPAISELVSLSTLKQLSKWNLSILNRNPQINRLGQVKATQTQQLKLSDIFNIKRGIATGANDFFILTTERIKELQIPPEFLTPILPSTRYLLENEILADALGNPILDRQLFLLNCKDSPSELETKHPAVWKYLQQGIEQGISERYLCKHRSLWYQQEVRQPAEFLCTYMGRQQNREDRPFRFILNHSQATAPNVYLMMYPKQRLKSLLDHNGKLLKKVWQTLNSISTDLLISQGRVYGDGLHKLEPRELANTSAELFLEILTESR